MQTERQRTKLQIIAPALVIGVAMLIALTLVTFKPSVKKLEQVKILPTVIVAAVELTNTVMTVSTQGVVKPQKQIDLASEVSGRVTWVSQNLIAGGRFTKGESLIRIDRTDYELSLRQAEATKNKNDVEMDIAKKDYRRQQNLYKQKIISSSKLDDAYKALNLAEAAQLAAKASYDQARLNLTRTEILAPFSGRVLHESIDEGGYVKSGAAVATIYADEIVEIRLPVANDDIGYLHWPQNFSGVTYPENTTHVNISSSYGGATFNWDGKLVRVESEVDASTRLFFAVAEVNNQDTGDTPPLTVGLFVDAEIAGRRFENIVSIPRAALLEDQVIIVDSDSRLRYRPVNILRIENETAIIDSGLNPGELLCITPPAVVVEGMEVKVSE